MTPRPIARMTRKLRMKMFRGPVPVHQSSFGFVPCGDAPSPAERGAVGSWSSGETQAPRQTVLSVQALRNARRVEVIAHGREGSSFNSLVKGRRAIRYRDGAGDFRH